MKELIKHLINLICIIIISPLTLANLLFNKLSNSDSFFVSSSQFLSLLPGKSGYFIRKNFFRFTMRHCDAECLIGFSTLFSHRDTEIHKGVYIGPQCNIGKSRIEKNCLLGSGVHILSGKGQHNFDDLSTPIQEQGGSYTQITIGEDTWIGNGSLIMANIGKKCVIGAGSVVIKDIPDYSIVGGNPAKVLKSRLPIESNQT
jgi:virginiamycin A acetyltransferase